METIEDIIAEIRKMNPIKEYPAEYGYGEVPNSMRQLADRLEKAYLAQLARGEMCTMSCRESGALLEQYAESEKRLTEEVKRLRAMVKSGTIQT